MAWYDLGRIRYSRSRTEDAEEAFEHALRLDPRSVKAENNLGLALEPKGKTVEAETAYRQAIEWQKGDPKPSEQPLLNLGILLINLDRIDEALSPLLEAYKLAPGDARISEQLGREYLEQVIFEMRRRYSSGRFLLRRTPRRSTTSWGRFCGKKQGRKQRMPSSRAWPS